MYIRRAEDLLFKEINLDSSLTFTMINDHALIIIDEIGFMQKYAEQIFQKRK